MRCQQRPTLRRYCGSTFGRWQLLRQEELAALKRSIAELGSVGRNLNQIAHVAHQTGRITGPGRDDLRSMLKICEALREHIEALVRANVASWESGYADTGD